jgi:alpha-D-ribose 1-methylphosphonate 5-triphosphate synthase subunit PhnG
MAAFLQDRDYILCEAPITPLRELVEELEGAYNISIVRRPSVCLTMLRTEDSLERQEFFLGETLVTDCEVTVDGQPGYGLCMGDQPQRCYCIAVLDALADRGIPDIEQFLQSEGAAIAEREEREFNLVMRTQVNFKLMEQE